MPSLPSSIFLVNYLYTNIFIYDFLIFLHDSLQAYSGILMLSFCLNIGMPLYACRVAFNLFLIDGEIHLLTYLDLKLEFLFILKIFRAGFFYCLIFENFALFTFLKLKIFRCFSVILNLTFLSYKNKIVKNGSLQIVDTSLTSWHGNLTASFICPMQALTSVRDRLWMYFDHDFQPKG